MRLLLTRPRGDCDRLEAMLRQAGHEVTSEPLLTIRQMPLGEIDATRLQAVVATSSNALAALDPPAALLAVPVFAVGEATARAARDKGFAVAAVGGAGAAELAALLAQKLDPAGGGLLYLRGKDTAFAMEAALAQAGFAVASRVVYQADPAAEFSAGTALKLANGRIDGVVLLSPRTAETYERLLQQAGLVEPLRPVPHFGLSDRIVLPLKNLGMTAIRVPARPNLQELVALIGAEATHCPLKA